MIIIAFIALFTYKFQEKQKIRNAAAIIVVQIQDIKTQIMEINSYIENGFVNDRAFYESKDLFTENYWNKYKYYFINKIDAYSYNLIDKFYTCAGEILKQQKFIKEIQRQHFLLTQKTINNIDSTCIFKSLNDICYVYQCNSDDVMLRQFFYLYYKKKNIIDKVFKEIVTLAYFPTQVQLSLEKALKTSNQIQVIGCEGFIKLQKIAKKRFF